MAPLKALGERLNAILIAKILQHQGIKTRFLEPKDVGLIVTGTPNNAEVNPETYVNLKRVNSMTMNELSSLVFMALRLLAISLLFLVVVQILQGQA